MLRQKDDKRVRTAKLFGKPRSSPKPVESYEGPVKKERKASHPWREGGRRHNNAITNL